MPPYLQGRGEYWVREDWLRIARVVTEQLGGRADTIVSALNDTYPTVNLDDGGEPSPLEVISVTYGLQVDRDAIYRKAVEVMDAQDGKAHRMWLKARR